MSEIITKDQALPQFEVTPTQIAARVSLVASIVCLIFLAALHLLSPEFDPAWRMVSEYALGSYGWVLSLMFIAWAISSWTLAFAIAPQLNSVAGKIGLIFLIAAGVGEAMASVFDIRNSLHELASLIGIGSLPLAAMLISISLARTDAWAERKKTLLLSANATWASVVLMAITFGILIFTFMQTGAEMTGEPITVLPAGVIALVGWTNRLVILAYCGWGILLAAYAAKPSHNESM